MWPGNQARSLPTDFLRPQRSTPPEQPGTVRPIGIAGAAAASGPASTTGRRGLPGLRHLGAVVAAVYAALSDPLVGSDADARERRAAHVRRAGVIAAGGVLTAVLVYSTFPVRTYLDQRAATDRARERLDLFDDEIDRLNEQVEDYNDPEVIEEIARRDYGLVEAGEEPYAVLPPPTETTTTAPTTTVPTPP